MGYQSLSLNDWRMIVYLFLKFPGFAKKDPGFVNDLVFSGTSYYIKKISHVIPAPLSYPALRCSGDYPIQYH